MRGIFLIIALVTTAHAAAQDRRNENAALDLADKIIREHRLLTSQQLRCSTLVAEDKTTARMGYVTVLEKHGGGCPGDPETSPRRFSMEIDMRTGAAKWDNNFPDMEMRPVPRRNP